MTIDGGLTDKAAFDYLREKTTPSLIKKLEDEIADIELGK